jgi:UDP-N-acetylglucosamine 1-carboxyvinyltransferase
MERILIRGNKPLYGRVEISGAKNSAVALIPAAILADGPVTIDNVPHINDVLVYQHLLKQLGAEIRLDGSTFYIDARNLTLKPLYNGDVKKLRASYYLMGALLGRFGEAIVGLPGGCNFGPRPIDQHIKGFQALGAEVSCEKGSIHLRAKRLVGARIYLDVVSVGATINIMLAAARAEGLTVIENAAREPEIIDVATILNSMGGQIFGAGTDVIKIHGQPRLEGCRHSIIPDRIEAGTYMIAAAATGGAMLIDNVIPTHLEPVSAKLREMGVKINESDDAVEVIGQPSYRAIDIKTQPYPGFPTDLQQPMTALLTKIKGTSTVTDNIYAYRFRHVDELRRMGASIKTEGRTAIVEGGTPLQAAKVGVSDLRAGATLIIAALMAEGVSEISGVDLIDRGYEQIDQKLKQLGAEVWRITKPVKSRL